MSSDQYYVILATPFLTFLLMRILLRRQENPEAKQAQTRPEFGVFSPMFTDLAYLFLLHLPDEDSARIALDRLRQICASAPPPHPDIQKLLDYPNWRAHLVAAAALILTPRNPASTTAAWGALDKGSWVAPQLAAALSIVDPNFQDEALLRLENLCPIDDSPLRKMAATEAHSAMGPGGAPQRSAKNAAALLRLVELKQHPQVNNLRNNPALQTLLAADIDASANLAESWLHHINALAIAPS